MSVELKPCPNCGGPPKIHKTHKKFYVECDGDCWTQTGKHWYQEDAVKEWNTQIAVAKEGRQMTENYMSTVVEKIIIERNKTVDNAILGEIRKIAVENGIETKIILNEKAIVNAIQKQTPLKAKISLKGTTDWNTRCRCPSCNKDLFYGQKYCSECGQKIDWGIENDRPQIHG